MKILHIGPDDPFVQFLGGKFESVSRGANIFITISSTRTVKYSVPGARHVIVRPKSFDLLRIFFSLATNVDAIVAHSLTHEAAFLFSALKRPVKIWSGWGFDYYGSENANETTLLDADTRDYVQQIQGNICKRTLRNILQKVNNIIWSAAVKSIDYFSAPIPTDFSIMRKSFPNFSGKYLQLNYGDMETMFAAGVEGNQDLNVLVGNSSSITNNHEGVFARLARCDLRGRRVIVPLSYGDIAYREFVVRRGIYYFGDAFCPLVDFLPLDEYNRIISSCNVVVMGHLRQQAIANIGTAIYCGANLYLNAKCPTYRFLRGRGIDVFDLEQLTGVLPLKRKTVNTIALDRKALEKFWGLNVVNDNVMECIRQIELHHNPHVETRR